MFYSLLYKLDDLNIFKSSWLSPIKYTLNDSGLPGICLAQSLQYSANTFRNILKDSYSFEMRMCGTVKCRPTLAYRVHFDGINVRD